MATLKCKMCSGDLIPDAGGKIFTCAYCGTAQTAPSGEDEGKLNLFNRANKQRLNSEFDKAAALYERLVTEYPDDAEGYWGLCLSKYGIEYVDDPVTGKKVPTCHRASYDAITADPDYKAALDHADPAARAVYMEQGYAIDSLQRGILDIVKNEKPFDVFLCYKETDAAGKRTPDSVIANDIYYQLTNEGFKVFYAAITLESKLGQEYEPYIFAALHSARVMLVIGTDPEYFNAVWVRNEWSRYLKLMKTDRSKLLIPCYRDMDAYDLPEEFSHLQAQDMSKIGFITDVIRGIKKVLQKDAGKAAARETVAAGFGGAAVAPLLERAFLFLEDGKWQDANIYCEKVLDIDPKNANAYLGKLMAELQVKSRKQLADCAAPFDDNENYGKVLRFGDEKLEAEMRGYIAHINERNENARLEGIYNSAVSAMNAANSEAAYKEEAYTFQTISGFRDADSLAAECLAQAENCRKDAVYGSALSHMTGNDVVGYEAAIHTFRTISGWRDADEQIRVCQSRIEEIQAKEEAERLEAARQEEARRIAREKASKKRKRIAAIVTPIVVVCIAFLIVLTTVIIPNQKYNEAVALMESGDYAAAYPLLQELDIKDSASKRKIIEESEAWRKICPVGGTFLFGAYEQNNSASDGKEQIEWLVLEKQGSKALVVSKYALDCKPYHTEHTDMTWKTCTLRKWLNNDFLNAAFSETEQGQIVSATVTADQNPSYGTSPGNDTTDRVFLLSIPEANKYFKTDSERICGVTEYAVAQGAYTSDFYSAGGKAACLWWLRSPGLDSDYAAYVNCGGGVNGLGYLVSNDRRAVRPALWIGLES